MLPFLYTYGQEYFSDRTKAIAMAVEYIIKFFFMIDVVLGFLKAFIVQKTGQLEGDAINIAKNYIKFYFWIDGLAAIPFGLFTTSPILFFSSFLKIIRLLRVVKIFAYLGISTQTRAKIRIFYLISFLIWVIHLVSCYLYSCFREKPPRNFEGANLFDFDFWVPPVDLNDLKTDFYDLPARNKYYILTYYALLLVIGNDIAPQKQSMLQSASMILIFGAFLVATVFGGIASEVQMANSGETSSSELIDFMYFSLEIHKIPLSLKQQIIEYMRVVEEVIEAHAQLEHFLDMINPH